MQHTFHAQFQNGLLIFLGVVADRLISIGLMQQDSDMGDRFIKLKPPLIGVLCPTFSGISKK